MFIRQGQNNILVAQNCIKNDLEIYSYLRKLSRFCVKFSCTALVIDKFCSKLTQYWKMDLIAITFSSKKTYIFLDPFLLNFVRLKTSNRDSFKR